MDSDFEERSSFLQPRDRSLNHKYLTFESIRINLAEVERQQCDSVNKASGCMQTYLRIKEANNKSSSTLYEIQENEIICSNSKDIYKRKYKFSKIFSPETTQVSIFNEVVKPKIFDFINGKSSSLFTYGASGSGKTYTIVGTTSEPGIIPRTLEYLFKSLPDISENLPFKPDPLDNIVFLDSSELKEEKRIHHQLMNVSMATVDKEHMKTFKAMQQRLSTEPAATIDPNNEIFVGAWVSFAEIYNENIYDLLKPDNMKANSREKLAIKMSTTRPYIKNLTSVHVSTSLEAYLILQYGLHNLKYASTGVNSHSSRSHSIFTVKLMQGSLKTNDYIVSYFNFCDLAGSEKLKRTLNVGERLKESNSINTSLLVLGRCINSIRNSQKAKDNSNRPIPYRESKLTQLFQRALCGYEDISMIININPEEKAFDESLHALNFSAIAREIEIKERTKVVKQIETECVEDEVQYQETIDLLSSELEMLQSELENRELDFEERCLNLHAELLAEYNNSNEQQAGFDNLEQVKRIEKFYQDLYEEELSTLRENSSITIVISDSSDDDNENIENKNVIVISDDDDDDDNEEEEDNNEYDDEKMHNQRIKCYELEFECAKNDEKIRRLKEEIADNEKFIAGLEKSQKCENGGYQNIKNEFRDGKNLIGMETKTRESKLQDTWHQRQNEDDAWLNITSDGNSKAQQQSHKLTTKSDFLKQSNLSQVSKISPEAETLSPAKSVYFNPDFLNKSNLSQTSKIITTSESNDFEPDFLIESSLSQSFKISPKSETYSLGKNDYKSDFLNQSNLSQVSNISLKSKTHSPIESDGYKPNFLNQSNLSQVSNISLKSETHSPTESEGFKPNFLNQSNISRVSNISVKSETHSPTESDEFKPNFLNQSNLSQISKISAKSGSSDSLNKSSNFSENSENCEFHLEISGETDTENLKQSADVSDVWLNKTVILESKFLRDSNYARSEGNKSDGLKKSGQDETKENVYPSGSGCQANLSMNDDNNLEILTQQLRALLED